MWSLPNCYHHCLHFPCMNPCIFLWCSVNTAMVVGNFIFLLIHSKFQFGVRVFAFRSIITIESEGAYSTVVHRLSSYLSTSTAV